MGVDKDLMVKALQAAIKFDKSPNFNFQSITPHDLRRKFIYTDQEKIVDEHKICRECTLGGIQFTIPSVLTKSQIETFLRDRTTRAWSLLLKPKRAAIKKEDEDEERPAKKSRGESD
jgi:hypothetical protein